MTESTVCWAIRLAAKVEKMTTKKKKKKITLISWNVNGLRAVIKKDFFSSLRQLDADIIALQEIKLQEPQRTDEMKRIEGYESYWSYATVKKGYSGVATLAA